MNEYEYHLVEEIRASRLTRAEFMRRAGVLGLSLGSVGAILSACGGTESGGGTPASSDAAAGKPQQGGVAKIALQTPTASVDPVQMDNIGANLTVPIAAEYLVYPNEKYELEPVLATEWRALRPDRPDVWEFTLREGVKFHSGDPMRAEDVVASIRRICDPESPSPGLTNFAEILVPDGVRKVDEQTVRFELERPYADFPYTLSAFNYNAVILPEDYEIGDFVKGGVGTGPYVLKSYVPKVRTEFVANKDYWGSEGPYLDQVVAQYFSDTASAVLALQSGAVDVYANTPYQGSEALFGDGNIEVFENPSSEYRAVHMRTDQEPFSDKRVRQALAFSLDRPALVDGLFKGRAVLGNDHGFAPIFPTSAEAIETVPQRERDVEKAKQLLADAGHPDGLEITLACENYLEEPAYGVSLAEQAKEAGFRIKVNTMSQEQYYGSADGTQPWLTVPFGLTGWGERGTPSQLIAPAYTKNGIWNSAHWKHDGFSKLMADFGAAADLQTQRKIGAEAAAIQHDETPVLITYWIKQLRAKRKTLHGIAPGPVSHIEVSKVWKSKA